MRVFQESSPEFQRRDGPSGRAGGDQAYGNGVPRQSDNGPRKVAGTRHFPWPIVGLPRHTISVRLIPAGPPGRPISPLKFGATLLKNPHETMEIKQILCKISPQDMVYSSYP